jgi:hypothetical protein
MKLKKVEPPPSAVSHTGEGAGATFLDKMT